MNWFASLPIALMPVAFVFLSAETAFAQTESAIDPLAYSGPAWSPYLVGALIGVLSMFTFYVSNKALGASSAYAKVAGLIGEQAATEHTRSLKYFKDNAPKIDWGVMLVFGIVIGGFIAAVTGGEITGQLLPELWQAKFGADSGGLRIAFALIGGMCMAFGARMAGGCTSGHGISGTLQLSIGSWIAAICFFVGGIAAAMLIFA